MMNFMHGLEIQYAGYHHMIIDIRPMLWMWPKSRKN